MLYQPAPGDWSESLSFVVGDNTLENVTKFQYLGSVLSCDNTLDEEIKNRLSRANYSFGRLAKKVWLNRHVSPRTKVKVYKAFVITSLLYGCQSWCTNKRYIKKLEAFHQKCLRRILGIKWQQHVTNNLVLERAGMPRTDSMISSLRCRWLGHVGRMDDTRLPKQVLFGVLKKGKRKQCKPKKRWKDCIGRDLKELGIEKECWYDDCQKKHY